MWTALRDTHAGGIQKLEWKWVVIEADEDEATSVFFSRFGINPNRVSCTCCGSDFSIWDDFDLDYIEDDEDSELANLMSQRIDRLKLQYNEMFGVVQ